MLAIYMSPAYGVKTVYRVVDRPGVDREIGGVSNPTLMGRVDILEAWLEVDGGNVYGYIKLNTSGFPSLEEVGESYRYLIGALLATSSGVKNLTMQLAINPGVGLVACSLRSDGENNEVLGSYEIVGNNPLIFKITCRYEGESFDRPESDLEFKVTAMVNPSTIGDISASYVDIVTFSTGQEDGGRTVNEAPDQSGQEPGIEEGGGGLDLIPLIAVILVVISVAAIYFLRGRLR